MLKNGYQRVSALSAAPGFAGTASLHAASALTAGRYNSEIMERLVAVLPSALPSNPFRGFGSPGSPGPEAPPSVSDAVLRRFNLEHRAFHETLAPAITIDAQRSLEPLALRSSEKPGISFEALADSNNAHRFLLERKPHNAAHNCQRTETAVPTIFGGASCEFKGSPSQVSGWVDSSLPPANLDDDPLADRIRNLEAAFNDFAAGEEFENIEEFTSVTPAAQIERWPASVTVAAYASLYLAWLTSQPPLSPIPVQPLGPKPPSQGGVGEGGAGKI